MHLRKIEAEGGSGHILLQICAALGAGDWNDILALVQKPGESDLGSVSV